MAESIRRATFAFPVGLTPFEIDAPLRANGALIKLIRQSWPAGPLFTWRVFERERGSGLQLLASAAEEGGAAPNRDGSPGDAPLTIELKWALDRDKDRIRIEIDALQVFNAGIQIDWI